MNDFIFVLACILVIFIVFVVGINDVVCSTATLLGTRTLPWKTIIVTLLISALPSFYRFVENDDRVWTWMDLFKTDAMDGETFSRFVFSTLLVVSLPAFVSLHSKYPLSLGPVTLAACSGFVLELMVAKRFSSESHYVSLFDSTGIFHSLGISFVLMPVISACITWSIYRLFIRGFLFADEQNRFKRSLAWCSVIYPISFAVAVGSLVLRLLSVRRQKDSSLLVFNLALSFFISSATGVLAYFAFKLYLRAWLKRRVFLKYPQEYAYYMERSEKIEQGDREARGLGPITDYYLNAAPSSAMRSTPSANSLDTSSVLSQGNINSNHQNQSPLSPAVAAGKLALNLKRSEELFRPLLIFTALATVFTYGTGDAINIFSFLKSLKTRLGVKLVATNILVWAAFLALYLGRVTFSRASSTFTGRQIVQDMTPAQGFAIQMGTLITLTISYMVSPPLPNVPLLCLLMALVAVATGSRTDSLLSLLTASNRTAAANLADNPNAVLEEIEQRGASFRGMVRKIALLWIGSILYGLVAGFLMGKLSLYIM